MSLMRRRLACGLAVGLAACTTVSPQLRDRAETHRQVAEMRLGRGEVEQAMREYKTSIELYAEDSEAHFGLSEAYRRKGALVLAEQHLLETLRLDPENVDARLNLGVVYLQMERWEDAIRVDSLLIQDPLFFRPARALVNRGWAHYKSGNTALAEKDYREALERGGASLYARMNLGILYYGRGETVEAVREFEHVLGMLQDRPPGLFGASEAEARFRLAQAYVKLGQHSAAIEHLERAERRGAEGKWGRMSREYLEVLR